MKTIPPPCPEPEIGLKYWRSLDQLAETPEFRQWVEREFPAGASELHDDVSRRHFVKIMSASFLMAGVGLTACRRPVEKILPFSKMPENYVHGVAKYYATSMPTRGSATPLVVKAHEGRPIKIEGNSEHPDSNGGTDQFAQASILNLYDPDRAQRHVVRGQAANSIPREQVIDMLAGLGKKFQNSNGQGLAFLMDRTSSPSRRRLQAQVASKFAMAKWYVHEAVDFDVHRRAASMAFGKSVRPYFQFDQAKVIVSLDCDFMGSEEDSYLHIRRYSQGRRVTGPKDSMNRLYSVEGLLSITGSNADHRLRIPASQVLAVAVALAEHAGVNAGGLGGLAQSVKVHEEWIRECAKDLASAGSQALVVAGHRQPLAVHLLAHAINAALGSVGKTMILRDAPAETDGHIADLTASLNAGQVDTLVIVGGNPAYDAPGELHFAEAAKKAKLVVRLGYYEDETFEISHWHLSQAHFLEAWGDAQTADGTYVPVQPLVEPLFGGISDLEVLARIGGVDKPNPHDIVRETFAEKAGASEDAWRKFLHDGFLAGSALPAVPASLGGGTIGPLVARAMQGLSTAAPTKESLEVVFHRDYSLDDGRYNNNGWLQECPDPMTKITWDNAVLVSRKTALELGLANAELVSIEVGGRSITGPVWIQPGLAENTLGLALGYGRERSGRVGGFKGQKVGFDVYPLRDKAESWILGGAKVSRASGKFSFSCTQDHWSMEGRPIIREATLTQYQSKPDFAKNMDLEAHSQNAGPIYRHPYNSHPALKSDIHQWGMVVDLNTCVGCNACVIACQSENNVPIVGKDQVARGREMHWLRIDRYFSGDPAKQKGRRQTADDPAQPYQEWIDDPQVVNQPMFCQHCESAPCESVCPVNATVHDEEGLNLMAYNRCVGTRYCSNNCAWKVRRFNFFDYNKRPIENLYQGPFARKDQATYDLIKLAKNPDVTVRMRGVMEKCTFCLQRIEGAKISQKVKAGASGDVAVPDGTIRTACQQVCPAGSITFGNLLDPESKVSKLKKSERNYAVLGFLDTKPRLTYLAKIRNPNPKMPDYYESPLSLREYGEKNGSPFESHHGGESHEGSQGHEAGKGAHE